MKEKTSVLNRGFRNKVAGCWLGKNIGGTLGAPFEGTHDMLDLTFYARDPGGEPEPNDDLDLQLLWLEMAERFGVDNLTPRLFGEFWLDFVTAGWHEYGVCCGNMQNGFYPPLSGSLNNQHWENSNGAWIRSEIWACLFPAAPEKAARFAWLDASCDHAGDGIYAELFTAALESMAFVQSDIRKLIGDALAFIPESCRIAQAVRHACSLFDAGISWKAARNAVVEENCATGFFQAPQNIAFVILGLLYGKGDFEDSLLYAVNCGDDTDCTAATVGSIMGIILGEDGIPLRWKEPVGRGIRNVSIDIMHNNISVPRNLDELTDRVVALAECPPDDFRLPDITDIPGSESVCSLPEFVPERKYDMEILKKDSQWMTLPLSSGVLVVSYPDGAEISPGGTVCLRINSVNFNINRMDMLTMRFHLPEGWCMEPSTELFLRKSPGNVEVTIHAPERIPNAVTHFLVELRMRGRNYPEYTSIPVQTAGAVQPEGKMEDIYDQFRYMRKLRKEKIQSIHKEHVKMTNHFSLIELLITIAVIAILSSFLLPALNKARGMADSARCQNTLKQMGVYCGNYMADYEDWIPAKYLYAQYNDGAHRKIDFLYYYIPYGAKWYGHSGTGKSTFVCPAESSPIGPHANGKFQYSHYSFNSIASGYGRVGNTALGTAWYRKANAVSSASRLIIHGDNINKDDNDIVKNGLNYRHVGRTANISYLDGHVKSVKKQEMLALDRQGLIGSISYQYPTYDQLGAFTLGLRAVDYGLSVEPYYAASGSWAYCQ